MAFFDLAPKESPDSLFGRARELNELVRLVRARRWVVVLGPRMVGKTSLVKALRSRVNLPGAYVNLWGVRSVQGLVNGLITGFNESASLRARLARGLRRIEGVGVGPGGISLLAPRAPLTTAWDLFDMLGSEAGECLVVLDEVQELSASSGRLLRLLGNLFNTHPNVCFVFTGSLFGLSRTLIHPDSDSPLYGRSPVSLTLRPFDRRTAEAFLRQGAKEAGIELTTSDLSEALDGPLDGTPGWLTLLGNHLTVRKMTVDRALSEAVREGKKVAEAELGHFLVNHEPRLYWPALKAIALGAAWSVIRSSLEGATGGPVNDATIQRVVRSLEGSYLARRGEGGYELVDPMVRTYVLGAGRPPRTGLLKR